MSHLKALPLKVNKGRRIGGWEVHFIRGGKFKVTPFDKSVTLTTFIAIVVAEGHISETALLEVNSLSPPPKKIYLEDLTRKKMLQRQGA